ncbi:non-classical arabinogalactan protein 31-like isoform X2 [Salvia splendens]|uniref:non-classical arabinogalactan protein 31-like isoform X2 n=1 Tax=Salvia splendens TaxID=180675 RepID=UPI001C28109B|nr:non-classical arabinogalactan protein 31-like isoform X2 [Salvia splendens]
MAFVSFPTSFVLSFLLLTATADVTLPTYPPPPQAPHPPPPPHHHHHHHHHHPPAPAPTHPPLKPPSHPPVKPPSHPPVKPPAHPPVKPPSHPPVKPPSHPPVKPPSHPPVKPPSHPPVKPPSHPPVKPPSHPPMRKMVAIQGVVFCKSCKYRGIDTLVGAVVKLECNNTRKTLVEHKTTDKNGYFLFMPQKLTTSGSHKCKVSLVSSPSPTCTHPTNLHGGAVGAILMRKPPLQTPPKPLPFELFTVGPFAFEAAKKMPCHY